MNIFFDEDGDNKYKHLFWVKILQHVEIILAAIVNKDSLTELKLRKIFLVLLKDRTLADNFEQAHIGKMFFDRYMHDISDKKEETAKKNLLLHTVRLFMI